MLAGICAEVTDLFEDKSINPTTLDVLRKMKPMRQIEAAELMNTAGNFAPVMRKPYWRRHGSRIRSNRINRNACAA